MIQQKRGSFAQGPSADHSGSQHVNADWTQETQVLHAVLSKSLELCGVPRHVHMNLPHLPPFLSLCPFRRSLPDLPLNLPLSLLLSLSPPSLSLASHPITSWAILPQLWARVLNAGDPFDPGPHGPGWTQKCPNPSPWTSQAWTLLSLYISRKRPRHFLILLI